MVTQKLLAKLRIDQQYVELIMVALLAVVARIIPHPPNVAPIAALALYSGARIGKGRAIVLPLVAMLLSDAIIGFHSTMGYVYGSFLTITLLGVLLRNNQKWGYVVTAGISSSLLFFFVTNFGVWREGNMYPHTLGGLMSAYEMGLPFLRNTFIGDFVYTHLFFYGFQAIGVFAQSLKLVSHGALSRAPRNE